MRVKENFLRRVVEIGKGRMRRASQRWKKIHQQKKEHYEECGWNYNHFLFGKRKKKNYFRLKSGDFNFPIWSLLLLLPNTCVMSFYSQFISTGFERFF
jgi:hypothetical protein